MDLGSQNLSFGDFSNLSDDEHQKVYSILHSSQKGTGKKVEFPWDNLSKEVRDVVKADHQDTGQGEITGQTLPELNETTKTEDVSVETATPVSSQDQGETTQTAEPTPFNEQTGIESDSLQTSDMIESKTNSSVKGSSEPSREVTPTETKDNSAPQPPGRNSAKYIPNKNYDRRSRKKPRSPVYYEKSPQDEIYHLNAHKENLPTVYTVQHNPYIETQPPSQQQHHMVLPPPPPTSHQPHMMTNPMVFPGANYGAMPSHLLPMYHLPPGYPMPTFQGGMTPLPVHPQTGMSMVHGHMSQQQQHTLMAMSPQPHVPPPTSHPQHIIPMSDMPGGYPRSPLPPPPPMFSQDVRQHPTVYPERAPPRQYVPHHTPSMENPGILRRSSNSERLPPDGREMTSQRMSEPPPSLDKQRLSPPLKIYTDKPIYKSDTDIADNLNNNLKSAPLIIDNKEVHPVENTNSMASDYTKSETVVESNQNVSYSTDTKTDSNISNASDTQDSVVKLVETKPTDITVQEINRIVTDSKMDSTGITFVATVEVCQVPTDRNEQTFIGDKTEMCKSTNISIVESKDASTISTPDNISAKSATQTESIVNITKKKYSDETSTVNNERVENNVSVEENERELGHSDENVTATDTGDVKDPSPSAVTQDSNDSQSNKSKPEEKQEAEKVLEQPKTVSWAGLFKKSSPKPVSTTTPTAATVTVSNTGNTTGPVNAPPLPVTAPGPSVNTCNFSTPVPPSEDSAAKELGELLYNYETSFAACPLQLRGLTNRSNWCYVNATLQALLACPAFYNLLKKLPNFPALTRGPSSTPVLDSLVEFVYEFTPRQFKPVEKFDKAGKKRIVPPELVAGPAFEPTYVYKMLEVIESSSSFKGGKQEDAEEFLSCVLNKLHEEMVAAMREVSQKEETTSPEQVIDGDVANGYHDDEVNTGEDEEWEQVGPKNKSVFTRKADFEKTPVSDIFAGLIRSAVFQAGSRESAMLEPFFTLQLDIQSDKVYTVRDALEGLVSKESVQGFTCSKTKTQVEVTRRLTLEALPPVLILHLKFFVYDKSGGCQKLLKKIDYATELEINKDLLSPNVRSKLPSNQRMYKLFAVVYHHGKAVTGGHYTTDVFHTGINGWVQIDDNNIRPVNLQQVLKFVSPRVPYLLYYRRMDL